MKKKDINNIAIQRLQKFIDDNYKSTRQFAIAINYPESTVHSTLNLKQQPGIVLFMQIKKKHPDFDFNRFLYIPEESDDPTSQPTAAHDPDESFYATDGSSNQIPELLEYMLKHDIKLKVSLCQDILLNPPIE